MSTEANNSKRVCKRIGTHSGSFHCDEALACYMLKILPQFQNCSIVRTRDPKEIEQCDIVVDVGAVYDPENYRFDHHQKTFTHSFSTINPKKPWTIKLSSAGLIYVHFGEEIIEHLLTNTFNLAFENDEERKRLVQIIYNKIYEGFVREIDAIDNGVEIADSKKYDITTNVSARVGHLNPAWNDKVTDENKQFEKAMELVGSEFIERIKYLATVWWPARSIVEKAVKKRFEVDPSGAILLLDTYCPWKSHLFDIEKDMNICDAIKYVLFSEKSDSWRIVCVPVNENSFANRLSIKEEWRGLRDDVLSDAAKIDGCIFVHATGFVGGAKSYESVLEMARKSLV